MQIAIKTTSAVVRITVCHDVGGARVAVETVALSGLYKQPETWIAGHLAAQLPYADIYPLFVRGDLARCDGRPLGAGLASGQLFLGRSAV